MNDIQWGYVNTVDQCKDVIELEGATGLYVYVTSSYKMDAIYEIMIENKIRGLHLSDPYPETIDKVLDKMISGELNLVSFSLWFPRIDSRRTRKLVDFIKSTTILESFTLYQPDWSEDIPDIDGLVSGLCQNRSITTLKLWGIKLGISGAELLCNGLKTNTIIESISLHSNQLGYVGTDYIIELVKNNSTLKNVDLLLNHSPEPKLDELNQLLTNETKIKEREMVSLMHRARMIKAIR